MTVPIIVVGEGEIIPYLTLVNGNILNITLFLQNSSM